jgi:hypothetical protein
MYPFRPTFRVAFAVLLLITAPSTQAAPAPAERLWFPDPVLNVSADQAPLPSLQVQPMRVDIDVLNTLAVGDVFRLPLFEGDEWRIQVQTRAQRGEHRFTITGVPLDRPHAYVLLSREREAVAAILHDAGQPPVAVQSWTPDTVLLMELDRAQGKPCGGGRVADPLPTGAATLSGPTVLSSASVTTVDVAVVYTDLARAAASGRDAMHASIENAVAQANWVMTNSAVNVMFRLVYRGEVDYVESSDMHTDLQRVTDDDGIFLDEVQCLRDHYGADLVTLVTRDGQYGGLAWIMCQPDSNFEDYGFNVVDWQGLPVYTLAHEMGHNFGCDHDPDNPSTCMAHAYSQGHRFWLNSNQQRTVMAYEPGNQIANFSNPDIDFFGAPTGIAGVADNARTLRETAAIVAGFRPAQYPVTPPVAEAVTAVPVQSNAVRITWRVCGADGYEIRRNGTPVGTTSDRSFTDTNVPAGSHCWTVVATNQHGSAAVSAEACLDMPTTPAFVLNGLAEQAGYLRSNPGMTIYAAVRGDELYVATWSTGVHPEDTGRNDHFLFVTDTLLPGASAAAPWGKSGNVAVAPDKPFIGAESENTYVAWFNAPAGASAVKSPFSARQMEGVIDLAAAFGTVPEVVYVAAAAYGTLDSGGLAAQAPAGTGPDLDPHDFLALYTEAIRDEAGTGIYDWLDPERAFAAREIARGPGGVGLHWRAVPGQSYTVEQADPTLTVWTAVTNLTAGLHDIALEWADTTVGATSRVYRVIW